MAGTREIAQSAGVDGDLAQRFVEALVDRIEEGDRVTIRGLGSFSKKTLPPRTFHTAVMKSPSHKPERTTVTFKPSAALLADLNGD